MTLSTDPGIIQMDAARLRERMRAEAPRRQESPERVLWRHCQRRRGYDVTTLPDAELLQLWDDFDRRRCNGMTLRDNLEQAARDLLHARQRQAFSTYDADAKDKAERRNSAKRRRKPNRDGDHDYGDPVA